MRVSNPRTLPHGVAATRGFSPRGVDGIGASNVPLLVPYSPLARLAFLLGSRYASVLCRRTRFVHSTPEPYPISGGSTSRQAVALCQLQQQALRSHNRSGAPARRRPHHHRARKPKKPPNIHSRSH